MAILWARRQGPSHGPYAEAWFDANEGIYRVRLTAEGRAKAEEYLSRYPHPIALLISIWPAAYRAARSARFSDEEIDSLCLEGVALAVARYDPTRGASLGTAIVWGVRAALTQAVRKAQTSLTHSRTDTRLVRLTDRLSIPSPDKGDNSSVEDSREELARYLSTSHLTKKQRLVLILRYGLNGAAPLSRGAASRALTLSTERIRQLEESAIRKIRSAIGLDLDWESAARSRILDYLSSMRGRVVDSAGTSRVTILPGANKAELSRRTGVPMWELRVVLPQLLAEGRVVRERFPLSRGRSSILFRIDNNAP